MANETDPKLAFVETKLAHLDPELAYEILVAALNVVGGVSPSVHRRIERAYDSGQATSSPTVRPRDLVELRRALNKALGGGLADRVIAKEDARRRTRRTTPAAG